MKKLLLATLALVFSISLLAQESKKIVKVTYDTSVDCEACVNTIMSSLPLEKGVKDVKVDLETKEVVVAYKKDKTDKDKIKRALEKLGYVAKEKKTKEETEKKK